MVKAALRKREGESGGLRERERERNTKVEEENKQLNKGRGLKMERMSSSSFFSTILLRNL